MPIALYPELTARLRATGKAMAPWLRLVEIETQLMRRAESAFLRHWFGGQVPVRDLNLVIAIGNIEALRRQYLLAKRSVEPDMPGLNLLGPLSGIAGLVVGMAMSPTGAILIASQMKRIAGAFVDQPWADMITIAYRLLGVVLLPVLGPAASLFIVLPLVLAAALGFAGGGNRTVRAVVSLLGELAFFIEALRRFWDQISGRARIENPLLKLIVDTLDRFAGFYVQLLGAVAILVTRIAPLIPNLLDQYRALVELIDAVMDALGDIFDGIVDALLTPFKAKGGLLDVLGKVFDTLMAIPSSLMTEVANLVEDAAQELAMASTAITAELTKFGKGFGKRLVDAFTQSALGSLVDRIKAMLKWMPAVIKAFTAPPTEEEKAAARKKALEPTLEQEVRDIALIGEELADVVAAGSRLKWPDWPDLEKPRLPAAPTLPDLDALLKKHPLPETPDLAAMVQELSTVAWEAQAKAPVPREIARDPASAFADQRRLMESTMPKPTLKLDDQRLRDLIYIAVGRVLPATLRAHAPQVRAIFDMIDEEVYGAPKTTEAERKAQAEALHPEKELIDTTNLTPIVRKLRFVAPGGQAPDLRAFRDLVVGAIEKQTYVAAAAR